MDSVDGLSNYIYTGGKLPGVPSNYPTTSSTSYSDSSKVQTNGNQLKILEGSSYHQRCSSESFLFEDQPSWLDDLLDESKKPLFNGSHRRSASDSYAFLAEATEKLNRREESKYASSFVDTETHEKLNQESEVGSKNLEGSQIKPSVAKTEVKPAKQHNAHRSRVRKLQYISHLERTVQSLQAQGVGVLAELEFVEQQNMILVMENRALKQRLENVSHEQIIKHWEQEMLEREIGRLQTMHNLKRNPQMQQNHPNQNQQIPKHRRTRSRDQIEQVQPNLFPLNTSNNSSNNTSPTGGSVRV